MQSAFVKLMRKPDNSLTLFFFKNGNIYSKPYTKDFSAPAVTVSCDVLPGFSVFTDGKAIMASVQKQSGDIFICRLNNGKWEEKPLIKGSTPVKHFCCFDNNELNIICNTPSAENNGDSLTLITLSGENQRSQTIAESIIPINSVPFTLIYEGKSALIFYRTKDTPFTVTRLAFSPYNTEPPTAVFTSAPPISDFSVIADKDKMHMVFILKARRGVQLLYRCISPLGLSQSNVLWEGNRAESCFIFGYKGIIYVFWVSGHSVYCVSSYDGGVTFSRPFLNQSGIDDNVVKAEYISLKYDGTENFTEIPMFSSTPNEIALIQSVCPDFVANTDMPEISVEAQNQSKEAAEALKKRIAQLETELEKSSRQIAELRARLSQAERSVTNISPQWAQKLSALMNAAPTASSSENFQVIDESALYPRREESPQSKKPP